MPESIPNTTTTTNKISKKNFLKMHFRRNKSRSYDLNPPDKLYNVIYLGNVLTVMGKGNASYNKPLSIIWQTYHSKKQHCQEIAMKLSVTRSGLKVEIKTGLTEYWAHRITSCVAPPEYPRIFCWVYKHEGKRMRPELRCHAVLCKKYAEPLQIANSLNASLHSALQEYKREKLAIEKARKNSFSGGMAPKRKIILQTGTLNFRPPVSRSKSAPRLGSIDEENEAEPETELHCDEESEFSDTQSLCYRTTPMLGGSVDDSCSLSLQSSSTISDNCVGLIKEDNAHDYMDFSRSESCPMEYNPTTSSSTSNSNSFEVDETELIFNFKRNVSMNRESLRQQKKRHCLRKYSHAINSDNEDFEDSTTAITTIQAKTNKLLIQKIESIDSNFIEEDLMNPEEDLMNPQIGSSLSDDGFTSCLSTFKPVCSLEEPVSTTTKTKQKFLQKDESFDYLNESGAESESADKDSLSDESGYYPEDLGIQELNKTTEIIRLIRLNETIPV